MLLREERVTATRRSKHRINVWHLARSEAVFQIKKRLAHGLFVSPFSKVPLQLQLDVCSCYYVKDGVISL
jgi:hypothetical protein